MRLRTALALLVMVAACRTRAWDGSSAAEPSGLRPDVLAGLPPDSARLQAQFLCEGDEPSISPDGRRVAYVRWGSIWLYDLESGTTRQVCENRNAHAVTWNPSGTVLAFQGDDSTRLYAKFWIWLVNPDGSNLRRFSEGPQDEHPLWSPDGKHLVWSRARRLWQADSTGLNGRFLTRQPSRYVREYARAWTADRSHLLFVRGSEMGEEFRFWQVGRDSTDDTPDSTRTPAYSRHELEATADGRVIYARGQPRETNEIRFWERGARGASRRCFVQDSLGVWLVSLAPDRSFVVFSSGDEEQMNLWLARRRPSRGRLQEAPDGARRGGTNRTDGGVQQYRDPR